jgi:hypothetical protein
MQELNERLAPLIEELRSDEDHFKRMYSKTFWRELLHFQKKTTQRIQAVKAFLTTQGITVSTEYRPFGEEENEDWLRFTWWNIPTPDDHWFFEMTYKAFENEQEVDVFFLSPLFRALGYQEADFSFEQKVDITDKGRNGRRKIVDLALYDGTDRSENNVLVVVEAKTPDKPNARPKLKNLKEAVGDLRYYRRGLPNAHRYMATNGDQVTILTFGDQELKPVLEIHRSEFKDRWPELYLCLGKPILLAEKNN